MNRQWKVGRRAGMAAGLILWIILAGVSAARGIVARAAAQAGIDALAADTIYLPLAMRYPVQTERISISSSGTQGNAESRGGSISADGRFVAFQSVADSLVEEDSNGFGDVFVRDRQTGITELVSVASDGSQGNYASYTPSISADGRFVAFGSDADNLVDGDRNGWDIFVRDLQSGVTERVSVASDGTQGDYGSYSPSISADGRYVAFGSAATNLVEGDTEFCERWPEGHNCPDIFVHDRQTGETEMVSVASDGAHGNEESHAPSISGDGRYVAFRSTASNLVEGDTNDQSDIFVHDRQTGATERVSVASDGTQADQWSTDLAISKDGRYVVFSSRATNLVAGDTQQCEFPTGFEHNCEDIFVHDRQTGTTTRVSVSSDGTQANGDAWGGFISGDGRYMAFTSFADNLVYGDTQLCGDDSDPVNCFDVFVHDRENGITVRVSVAGRGTQGNGVSYLSAFSADGRYVVFGSDASNLVEGDTNLSWDVFVRWWNSSQ